ncbi:MAG: Nramp family divalent metal transporter [Planctomycetota bacterium]|nr:Nramp family divalent metal transporter [Planctomycetota bacterium]
MTEPDHQQLSESTVEPGKKPGGALEPWDVGNLPAPPVMNWKKLPTLIGPGILMAGVAIGAGEWLFGPAVSAQYGGTLLWLATLSILGQVFFNIEVMRYALYCGEPIVVGYFRTTPGPRFWLPIYLVLEICNIWPFMAANAAVPLAAAVFGHLPTDLDYTLLGITMTESEWVKVLGYVIFLLAFLPLIFGGTIYRVIEKMMTFKVVVVLLVVAVIAVFQVSWDNMIEVVTGFGRFGQVPDRAESVIAGRHFSVNRLQDGHTFTLRGTIGKNTPDFIELLVDGSKVNPEETALDEEVRTVRDKLEALVRSEAQEGRFRVEDLDGKRRLLVRGSVRDPLKKSRSESAWLAESYTLVADDGSSQTFAAADKLPGDVREWADELVALQGMRRVGLVAYIGQHGKLPDLNWAIIVAFAAIAGAGGLSNTLASNYSRDKGWGMGHHVGAIPSAIGGHEVELSHVGMVFEVDDTSRRHWKGWIRHIVRDQAGVWLGCCLLGMALPCMMSLEFIRNVPVEGNRAAAMTAVGLADHLPDYRALVWTFMLMVSFLVLAPNAVFTGEQISRRWTDVIWTISPQARRLEGGQVRLIYYGILSLYGVWGLFALAFFDPLQIAIIGAVLQNVALGCAAMHTLYVNRTLLPREMRPNRLMQVGLVFCSVFFIAISVVVLVTRVF